MTFLDPTPDFQVQNQGQHDGARARFYVKPLQNNFLSEQRGQPVFEDVEFVEILIPGDRKTVVDRRVKDEDRLRWAQLYAAFKNQQEAPSEGTPLSEWAGVTRAQAEELAFAHVKTIEQLANLSDDQLGKAVSMGGFALRDKAKRWLEQASGSAPMEALAAEVRKKDEDIAVLKGTVADLSAKLDALLAQRNNGPSGAAA